MKKTLSVIFVLTAFLFAFGAPSGAAELKIAYANLQKALNDSEAGIKAKDDLKVQAQKLEEELGSMQAELKGLKEEIDKKAAVWNAETRNQKEQVFRAKSQEFQKQYMQYGEALNKKKQEIEGAIVNELRSVVAEIAKKKGLTYVFEQSAGGLIYAPEDADITDEVIKMYNKRNTGK